MGYPMNILVVERTKLGADTLVGAGERGKTQIQMPGTDACLLILVYPFTTTLTATR